eukprot:231957_1
MSWLKFVWYNVILVILLFHISYSDVVSDFDDDTPATANKKNIKIVAPKPKGQKNELPHANERTVHEEDIKYSLSPPPFKTITLTTSEHAILQKSVDEYYKNWKLSKTVGEGEYDYIFEWNCFCSTCLELPKYISIKDDKIISIKYSDQLSYDYYENEDNISPKTQKKLNLIIPNYGCDNLYLHSKHYHNIEGLFHIIQQSLHPNYYDPNRHIISITFDKELYYPKTVYISNDLHELGWNIKCLSMTGDGRGISCNNSKKYPFWIEKKWQEIIGWLMILLVLCWSCIGYFIAYLKKRARKKHREHVREQMKSNNKNKNKRRLSKNKNSQQEIRKRKNKRKQKNKNQIIEESDGEPVPNQSIAY